MTRNSRRLSRLLAALLPLLVLASVPTAAAARDIWPFVQERGQRERQALPPRPDDRREAGRQSSPYPQRLSPDERRQLRRDLHDANRDMPSRRKKSRR